MPAYGFYCSGVAQGIYCAGCASPCASTTDARVSIPRCSWRGGCFCDFSSRACRLSIRRHSLTSSSNRRLDASQEGTLSQDLLAVSRPCCRVCIGIKPASGVSSRWWYLLGLCKPFAWCGHCTKLCKAARDGGTRPHVECVLADDRRYASS